MTPERAIWLASDAIDAGWTVLARPGIDSGGARFITVEGQYGDDGYFRVTWHTRDTRNYRIFGRPFLGRTKAGASHSSLRAVQEEIHRARERRAA